MEPVVTPTEMGAIDAEAPEPIEELIERAGWATARAATRLLGGRLYGKRILVLVGKGNNGADGRSAARHLDRRGARCCLVAVGDTDGGDTDGGDTDGGGAGTLTNHRYDLVIDAGFGTGLGRDFIPPDVVTRTVEAGAPVLAVDIPSGVDGLTGATRGRPVPATATVTFAASKPGLLFEPGRSLAGALTVGDIGLDCSRATMHLLDRSDVRRHWPLRPADHHKWRSAVLVVGGSPGMTGAPGLSARAAFRAGAGYVLVAIPGTETGGGATGGDSLTGAGPVESVHVPTPIRWVETARDRSVRCGAVVIGPGLVAEPTDIATYLMADGSAVTPTVFDAGALDPLADVIAAHGPAGLAGPDGVARHVLTPHDGEFTRLFGHAPGPDRIAATRAAAETAGAVVLLKGPTTVVAHPDGRVLLSTSGDQRLATAGTGDVLAGVIAAGLAGGLDPLLAAGLGTELHGTAGLSGYRVGMTAGDLPSLIAAVLSE